MASDFASHYEVRLDRIAHEVSRLAPNAPHPVVLLGDSLSEQNPVRELASIPVLNMGISGDEIVHPEGGLMPRLRLLPLARPSHVMVLIGINDLNNSHKSVDTLEPQYEELVRSLKSVVPTAALHLQLLLPARNSYTRLMPQIGMMNVIIEETARRHLITFVDTFTPLTDDNGLLGSEFTHDGLHLNETGYEKLNKVLEHHLLSGESY